MTAVAVMGVAAAMLAVQFREVKSEYGILITIAGSIFIFYMIVMRLGDIFKYINQALSDMPIQAEYITLLFRVAGITYITEFASDICKDCGYNAVANQVQIFGKLTVLSYCIPIIKSLTELIGELI